MPRAVLAATVGVALVAPALPAQDVGSAGEPRASSVPAPVAARPDRPAVAAALSTITAADVRRRVAVLAHDSLRGRATPSPELEQAARWAAAEFERMGLVPALPEGWLQRFPVRERRVDADASSLASSRGARVAFGEDVVRADWGGFGPAAVRSEVVLLLGVPGPDELDPALLRGRQVLHVGPAEGVRRVWDAAAEGGAHALLLPAGDGREAWRALERRAGHAGALVGGPDAGAPLVLHLRDAAAERLTGLSLDVLRARAGERFRSRVLPDLLLDLRLVPAAGADGSAPNVVAMLPGSDPELRDEVVVFSAHLDHVGVGRPDEAGDSIYNGADDDASGVSAVLEVAEALASLPEAPARSTLFLLVAGEEQGLWGSAWFVSRPPVPLERVVAALNADMVGRNAPDTIVAIGRDHSDLGAILDGVLAAAPETGLAVIDDPWPEERFYQRSDHFNFARRGVPVLFLFAGTHEDYHRPGDELSRLDVGKVARVGRLLFLLGLELAERPERPRWDPAALAGASG